MKKVLDVIGVVIVFAIPIVLIVLFTLKFEEYWNGLQQVQHMMY